MSWSSSSRSPTASSRRRGRAAANFCFTSLLSVPGLAMGLGGVGVRLIDLVALYGGIARLGTTITPSVHFASELPVEPPRRLLDPAAAWQVANVLIGTPPPENAAGGRIAFKTGTSYGYRDAWAVGFDGKRTIGVWV